MDKNSQIYEMVDKITWKIVGVNCDDVGDTYYDWQVFFYLDDDLIYDDFYHNKPNARTIYNNLLSAAKDGSLRDILLQKINEKLLLNKKDDFYYGVCEMANTVENGIISLGLLEVDAAEDIVKRWKEYTLKYFRGETSK